MRRAAAVLAGWDGNPAPSIAVVSPVVPCSPFSAPPKRRRPWRAPPSPPRWQCCWPETCWRRWQCSPSAPSARQMRGRGGAPAGHGPASAAQRTSVVGGHRQGYEHGAETARPWCDCCVLLAGRQACEPAWAELAQPSPAWCRRQLPAHLPLRLLNVPLLGLNLCQLLCVACSTGQGRHGVARKGIQAGRAAAQCIQLAGRRR